jgi:hypothetical protein
MKDISAISRKSGPVLVRTIIAGTTLACFLMGTTVGTAFAQSAKPAAASSALEPVTGPPVLKVEGAVPTPLALTLDDLAKLPRQTYTTTADGSTVTYEGVLLYDILIKAGWKFGHEMTGKPMASYLLVTARDGYQVVFALAEIDPQFAGAKVIVADKKDGLPLTGPEQPFHIFAPQDKMRARSVYSAIKVEVVRLRQ